MKKLIIGLSAVLCMFSLSNALGTYNSFEELKKGFFGRLFRQQRIITNREQYDQFVDGFLSKAEDSDLASINYVKEYYNNRNGHAFLEALARYTLVDNWAMFNHLGHGAAFAHQTMLPLQMKSLLCTFNTHYFFTGQFKRLFNVDKEFEKIKALVREANKKIYTQPTTVATQ